MQTEVCNTSGTSYHKALCSTRMFPHPFRLHAHWHRRVAFLFYAHMLIRSAHAHIRIMHSRLYEFLHTHIYRFAHAYIQICTCIYTDLHGYIYGNAHSIIRFSWRPDTVLFYPGRQHDLQFYRKMNKIFKNCNKTCIKAQNKLQRF